MNIIDINENNIKINEVIDDNEAEKIEKEIRYS